ncbi:MAG: hypothetical protein HKO96_02820 [Flavobacteriaceae bacterium]|nr:NRDE family protein [Bacteroidia bacterium]NNK69383.1 hypothetical protein [Flavobacteriaceae bacterium]
MCTVTFIRHEKNDFILTSNRDEAPDRYTHPPQIYSDAGGHLLYPKDSRAGGTWIGISEQKRLVCVLNGAFVKHHRTPPYEISRGQIAKELMVCENLGQEIDDLNLMQVEPFTMIIVEWKDDLRAMELIWDGFKKHLTEVTESNRIWSSSSLYSSKMKAARNHWFNNFKSSTDLDADSIWKFHHSAGDGNKEYGVIMDRGKVRTTSVTQVMKQGSEVQMIYDDLQANEKSVQAFKISQLNNG